VPNRSAAPLEVEVGDRIANAYFGQGAPERNPRTRAGQLGKSSSGEGLPSCSVAESSWKHSKESEVGELDAFIAYGAATDHQIRRRRETAQRAEIDRRALACVAIGPPAATAAHPEDTVVPSSRNERLR
jgi:hypothetical protein